MNPDYATSSGTVSRNLILALTVVIVTSAAEFFFRHFVMFWFPTIGNLEVNDLISLFVVYALLMFIFGRMTGTAWKKEASGIRSSLRELIGTWDYIPWLMLVALSATFLPLLDRLLWGNVKLMPWLTSSYRDQAELLVNQAPLLKGSAFIIVNGFFVPIAEEFIWRGIIQERLLRILPAPAAIGITAVLFSFKHVLVDDSFGRFLFIIAFGVICGMVAYRKSWRASASLHLFTNTVATILALIAGLV